jgi:hypothetical protein
VTTVASIWIACGTLDHNEVAAACLDRDAQLKDHGGVGWVVLCDNLAVLVHLEDLRQTEIELRSNLLAMLRCDV